MINTEYSAELSSSEIITLAAILKCDAVFGINKPSGTWLTDTKRRIDSAFQSLEEKGLIYFTFDGDLYLKNELKKIIQAMTEAESVALFTHIPYNSKKQSYYVFYRQGYMVRCEKTGSSSYSIVLKDSFEESDLPKTLSEEKGEKISITLPLKNAEKAKKLIRAFDTDSAGKLLLEDCGHSEASELMTEVLSGGCSATSIRIRVKNGRLYTKTSNDLIISTSKGNMKLYTGEDELLKVESISKDELLSEIKRNLEVN
ncbi:MAG: hypothetical protein E7652_00165 [Ruminococcaceae bacterium]|nr:hypothetical protein [Oscillospiraceae bacterium]